MKKLYIHTLFTVAALLFFASSNLSAQTITVTGVPTTLCANEGFTIGYTASGFTPLSGNGFVAELSDEFGVFIAFPVVIGTETSTELSGTIYVNIPETTVFGAGYRIRVNSTVNDTGFPVIGDESANININCTTRDYYWTGGTGDWSDLTHWEYYDGGILTSPADVLPTTNDNVNFDGSSFPTGGTLTFDQPIDINDFYWEPGSGANNPTIISNGNNMQLRGDLVLDAGIITEFGYIYFNSTKENIEINYGDNILSNNPPGSVDFGGGGSWELNSKMSAHSIFLSNATFYTNDYQINLNAGLNGAAGSTLFTGSSHIFLTELFSSGMIITGDATWHLNNPYGSPGDFRNVAVNKVIIESGDYNLEGNTIDTLILMPGTGIVLSDWFPTAIVSNFEAIGTRDKIITIESQNPPTQATINMGAGATVTANYISVNDNTITGDGTDYFVDNWIENGNNTGWDFNLLNKLTGLSYYWVGGSGNWSDNLGHWAKLASGGGFRDSPPGAFDNVYFTSNSFPSGGKLTIDTDAECNIMKWQPGSGATNPKIYAGENNSLTVYGDFTLDAGVNRELKDLYFEVDVGDTLNLDFGDNSFTLAKNDNSFITLSGGGIWELNSDMSAGSLDLRDGIFNSNGYQIDAQSLFLWDTNESNWDTSVVDISKQMFDNNPGFVIFNADNSTFNFSGTSWLNVFGSFNFYDAVFSGNINIGGTNTYNNLAFLKGADITLASGSTQLVSGQFSATGLRDQPITIKSSAAGNLATIKQSTGTNTTSFLIIEDVEAQAATFNTDYSTYGGTALSNTTYNGWTFSNQQLTSLDFYWVGNSGNWSDFSNHWATSDGGTTMHDFSPGSGDNVIFTDNSFTIIGQEVILDNPIRINNMTWSANSGANSPTITAINDNNIDNSLTLTGTIQMANGVERNISNLIFESAAANINIDFADNVGNFDSPDKITFTGGGSWDLQSRLETYHVFVYDATLNTNNNEIDFFSLDISSPTSFVNLGTSTAYLENLNDNSGGLGVMDATSSTIIINDNANFQANFALNDVQVLAGGDLGVENSFSVNNLTLEPGSVLTISQGQTLTTNTISALGTPGMPIRIKSNSEGNQGFIWQTTGTVNATYVLISDNDADGGATFSLINATIAGDPLNVTGWGPITPAPTNQYRWVGGSGNWSDFTNHWEYSIGGSPFNPASTPPGIADDVLFDENSFSGTGQEVTIDQLAYCNNMTWTTTLTQSPVLSGVFDIPLTVFGSFILADGVKRNIPELEFQSYNPGNIIDMADNQIAGIFESIGFTGTGEWTLGGDIKIREVSFRGGTFNTNGFDLFVNRLSFSNTTPKVFNAGNSHIYTNELANSNNSNLTFNKGTSTVHIVNSNEQNNGGNVIDGSFNFYNVIIEDDVDAILEEPNSFNTLTVNAGATLTIGKNNDTESKTQFISDSLTLVGTANSPVIINSAIAGIEGIFSVPGSGIVTADNVILKDNRATGGADFTATSSSQLGNVTGWNGLKQGQTINFLPLDDITLSQTIDLTATSSSTLAVNYTVLSITGDATIVNDTVLTPTTTGLVAVVASQSGNFTYGAAQEVTRYVHLNQGTYPNELGQMKQASYVVGAPNGVSKGPGVNTNKSVNRLSHAIVSPDGKLIAAGEGRVMIWNELPDAYDIPADVVVGQSNFTSSIQTASQSVLAPITTEGAFLVSAVVGPNGELIVSDGRGVLIWNTIPATDGVPADVIIGQTNFTSTAMGVAQDKFASPAGLAVSNDGKLIICDIAAHRVLIYDSIPATNGAAANVVIGQPNFTSGTPGTGQQSLNTPVFVAVSPDNKLIISDAFNHRILIYDSIPATNNAPADVVIGQDDFDSNASGISGNSFNIPAGVAVSRTGKLAISDIFNSRVLVYNQIPANNTVMADIVLGQPDFDTNTPVNEDEITLRSISQAGGLAWDLSENLIISDLNLDRVMVYGAKDITPPAAFTTGAVTTVGGTVVAGYLNATNTSVEITVPIANDPSLNGGTIQMQVQFDAGAFADIGGATNILNANLGGSQVVSIDTTTLNAAISSAPAQDSIVFRALLIDVVNNQTTGTQSDSTLIIDTTAPTAFNTGEVAVVGGILAAGYWNATNTSVGITVPIAEPSGTVQMQVSFDGVAFADIGTATTISAIGSLVINIDADTLIAATGYDQGATITFRAVITDIAGNQTTGNASTTTLIIDTTPPDTFDTGDVNAAGGTIIPGIWNSTNTSVDINVPIDNEPSLVDGTVQMQVQFDTGGFADIGGTTTIQNGDLGNPLIINIDAATLKNAIGYDQGATIFFRAVITDVAGNQTTGNASTTTLTIDEGASAAFTTGAPVTVGGVVYANYWNSTNTAIDIAVPINEPSFVDGTVQMQIKIGEEAFADIDTATTITNTDFNNTEKIITISSDTLELFGGFAQNAIIRFRAIITDSGGNPTVGSESPITLTIDTVVPKDFTTNVTTLGEPIVSGYWNAGNTGVEVTVSLDNTDNTLTGGTIQLRLDANKGDGFFDVGAPDTIFNISSAQIISFSNSDFVDFPGFAEGTIFTTTAVITDIAGNSTTGTISEDNILIDRVAPEIDTDISTIPTTYENGGTQLSIKLKADTSGINSFVFYHNLISSADADVFTALPLNLSGGSYIPNLTDIIDNSSEQYGLLYYIEIADNAGNVFTGNKNPVNIRYPNGIDITNLGFGTATKDYKIMAIPLDLDNKTVMDVFEEHYGTTFDKSKMRIFSYPGGNATTYNELSGSSTLSMGAGYFALAAKDVSVSSPAGVTSFETILDASSVEVQGFSIILVSGWNMIGNPFMHTVVWDDIKTLSGITNAEVDQLQTYSGSWNKSATSLKAGEGAFVLNNTGGNFTLKIPAKNTSNGRLASHTPNTNSLIEDSWEVLFKATATNGKELVLGGVGMEPEAGFSKDRFDWLNPPSFASIKLLDFDHPEFFMSPSFNKDIRETAAEEKWVFTYKVDDPENPKQKIHWDNSYFGDNTPDLYLVDKTHFTTINMKEVNTYSFSHSGATKFEVYFGYDVLAQIIPEELITQSPYPNPFTHEIAFNLGLPKGDNYTVEIRIFDTVGKVVRSIAGSNIASGYNSIIWDGLNIDGAVIPNGMYAYSIHINGTAINTIKTGKIIKR